MSEMLKRIRKMEVKYGTGKVYRTKFYDTGGPV